MVFFSPTLNIEQSHVRSGALVVQIIVPRIGTGDGAFGSSPSPPPPFTLSGRTKKHKQEDAFRVVFVAVRAARENQIHPQFGVSK